MKDRGGVTATRYREVGRAVTAAQSYTLGSLIRCASLISFTCEKWYGWMDGWVGCLRGCLRG